MKLSLLQEYFFNNSKIEHQQTRSGWHRALQAIMNQSRLLLDLVLGMPTPDEKNRWQYKKELQKIQLHALTSLNSSTVLVPSRRAAESTLSMPS
jgi:hypothetical protein